MRAVARDTQKKCACERQSRSVASSSNAPPVKVLRSSTMFDWKRDCFFCSTPAVVDNRHPGQSDMRVVRTLGIKETVLGICLHRNDEWD